MKKKLFIAIMILCVSFGLLAGCGGPKPEETVNDFLTSIKNGDYKKAITYVHLSSSDQEFNLKNFNEDNDGINGKVLFKALASNYKFEKPVVVSTNDNSAKVKVKITSVDMQMAITKALGEVMPMAFASAFSESENSDDEMTKLMETTLVKDMTDKNATMSTREVTLNLKKDKDGNYKIVSDNNLMEAVMANADALNKMFNE
ncbi:DUF4878 domain-containing protein [Bacillus sp. FJAT-49736]|uniref:DUF4878 domain-containing protein n=1 Tax=Bacillus sp. FJAT-49736 TaxID=2833582 RepID=UPI001BC96D8A|nr:DUF4878 domain-containing protein [Bacillus sp. FJAT-49736]MBS4174820.1 DUF4878 domain-containing protein [Bacillus sp. FJAT-49736]MBS4175523.1 DUF4878 domain-containing protein [Bacillus sp. FJAT-49736]